MDNATIVAIVTCLITRLLSAGGWKFYEAVLRQRADQRKEEKNENDHPPGRRRVVHAICRSSGQGISTTV